MASYASIVAPNKKDSVRSRSGKVLTTSRALSCDYAFTESCPRFISSNRSWIRPGSTSWDRIYSFAILNREAFTPSMDASSCWRDPASHLV
jgi:hypothetical protein